MITAAIVAEFNPLHNGHKYLINEVKRKLNADRIIVIMSGDYVQRGEPAILNKYTRASMATLEGADLVLLLPTLYSLSGADLFALSSVSILDKLGCVDYLCFASECGDINLLDEICEKVNSNDYKISNDIKLLISQGMTYARARATIFPEYSEVLDKSNNILALEYIRAIKALNSPIKPFTIKRLGKDYNDSCVNDETYASATGLRSLLIKEPLCLDEIQSQIPEGSFDFLKSLKDLPIVDLDMFSSEIYYSVLSNIDRLENILDINDALSNKIRNNLMEFNKATDFIELLKTKDLTYSRISRALMHILLNIELTADEARDSIEKLNHIRILAMNKEAGDLTAAIKRNAKIELITSVPKASDNFNGVEDYLFKLDLKASTLYDHVVYKKYGIKPIHEYSKKFSAK